MDANVLIKKHNGPKKFVPPDLYQPGASAPPRELAMPTRRIIMSPAIAPAPIQTGPPPHRASVLRFNEAGQPLNARQQPAPEPKAELPEDVVVQGSHATRVFDDMPEEIIEEGPAPADDFTEDERQKLTELGPDGLPKAHIHLQRKLGEQGATIAALQAQLQDVLAATTGKQEPTETDRTPVLDLKTIEQQITDLGATFLDDIPGSLKKLAELSAQTAQASVMPLVNKNAQDGQKDAARSLVAQYPGLITDAADAAHVDTAAALAAQKDGVPVPRLTHYQAALDAYAKKIGWTKPAAGPKANAEVDAMKQAASTVAPVTATVKAKGKTWKKSELDALLTRHPEQYRELQPEILRAYQEGRVR